MRVKPYFAIAMSLSLFFFFTSFSFFVSFYFTPPPIEGLFANSNLIMRIHSFASRPCWKTHSFVSYKVKVRFVICIYEFSVSKENLNCHSSPYFYIDLRLGILLQRRRELGWRSKDAKQEYTIPSYFFCGLRRLVVHSDLSCICTLVSASAKN